MEIPVDDICGTRKVKNSNVFGKFDCFTFNQRYAINSLLRVKYGPSYRFPRVNLKQCLEKDTSKKIQPAYISASQVNIELQSISFKVQVVIGLILHFTSHHQCPPINGVRPFTENWSLH